jgi:hypothetical protein
MNDIRFDDLSQSVARLVGETRLGALAAVVSRRTALGALAGATLRGFLASDNVVAKKKNK